MIKKKFGVIFDLDGVLIDSSEIMNHAFNYAFSKFYPDKKAPFNEFIKHTGKGFLAVMDEMNLPQEMYKYFFEKSVELIPETLVFAGIEDLLNGLKQNNIYVGIATGKDKHRTSLILKHTKLLPYFDLVVCSDEVERGKPYSDSIDTHIKHSGLERNQVMFIGDSVSDIQCSRKSKVSSVAVLWGLGKREDLAKENPNYFAYGVDDLEHIFLKKGILLEECLGKKYWRV